MFDKTKTYPWALYVFSAPSVSNRCNKDQVEDTCTNISLLLMVYALLLNSGQ